MPLPKRAKRLLQILAAGLLALAVVGGLLFYQTRRVPAWYVVPTDPARIDQSSRQAEDKLQATRNWAAAIAAAERRAERGTLKTSRVPVPPAETTLHLTGEELTSFLLKWSKLRGYDQRMGQYLQDPVITTYNNHLVLAGKAPDLGLVLSIHLRPELTPEGKLQLHLDQVTGGTLPLPDSIARAQLDRLRPALTDARKRWSADAKIDAKGQANGALSLAASARLLQSVLDDKSIDPVAFFPIDDHSLPVRITKLSADEKGLTLTVTPIPPADRPALVATLK